MPRDAKDCQGQLGIVLFKGDYCANMESVCITNDRNSVEVFSFLSLANPLPPTSSLYCHFLQPTLSLSHSLQTNALSTTQVPVCYLAMTLSPCAKLAISRYLRLSSSSTRIGSTCSKGYSLMSSKASSFTLPSISTRCPAKLWSAHH